MNRDDLIEELAKTMYDAHRGVVGNSWEFTTGVVCSRQREQTRTRIVPIMRSFVAGWLDENEALIADEGRLIDAVELWTEEME